MKKPLSSLSAFALSLVLALALIPSVSFAKEGDDLALDGSSPEIYSNIKIAQ